MGPGPDGRPAFASATASKVWVWSCMSSKSELSRCSDISQIRKKNVSGACLCNRNSLAARIHLVCRSYLSSRACLRPRMYLAARIYLSCRPYLGPQACLGSRNSLAVVGNISFLKHILVIGFISLLGYIPVVGNMSVLKHMLTIGFIRMYLIFRSYLDSWS